MKIKNKKSLIVIIAIVAICIFVIVDLHKEIKHAYEAQIVEMNDMKYPRQNPVIRKIHISDKSGRSKIIVFGGDINDKNIITEESFILNDKNSNISEQKFKEIKSYFNNKDNYLFKNEDNNIIVKLKNNETNNKFGIEIYDTKIGKMKLLKSRPTLNKYEVGDCIKVIDNNLFVWSGINSDPKNSRMEIFDLINDKKSTIALKTRTGGIGNHYANKDIIFLLGGIDNATNEPTKEIQAIDLNKMTIEHAGELVKPQVQPKVLYADKNLDGGTNASIDKNSIQMISVYPFLDNYPKNVYSEKSKKLPQKLQNANLNIIYNRGSIPDNYLIFDDSKNKKTFIVDKRLYKMEVLKTLEYNNQNINYFELGYRKFLLLVYQKR